MRRIWLLVVLAVVGGTLGTRTVTAQESYERISGEGSSWAANAIDAMRVNVRQFGMTVDFNPSGSTNGRRNYLNGQVDFAASDIPFQFHPEDGSPPENPAPDSYAYIPVVAGGTSFIYNLTINGQRVTNLRLSGENVAKIFTGAITMWNDPAIQADNPGLAMPGRQIVPVVRSDGSGSSAQFTAWMIDRHPAIWNDYCQRSGRAPACGFTSYYPTESGSATIAQNGDTGVATYVSQNYADGAIGYVNYSYALQVGFPVVKVLNAAGFYTEPTPQNVAVSLTKAEINNDKSDLSVYLTQKLDKVYTDTDPRNYQLSSYSYFILPIKVAGQFNERKGRTLGAFAYYAMCQAQQQSESLGYSPMPVNLVQASFEQIRLIPGVEVQNIEISQCNNPTFSPDGHNVLADTAPMPQECDRQGAAQCTDGTGGAKSLPTAPSGRPGGPGAQPNDPGQGGDPNVPDPGGDPNAQGQDGNANNSGGGNDNGAPGGASGNEGAGSDATSTTAPCATTTTTSTTVPTSADPSSTSSSATTTSTSTSTSTSVAAASTTSSTTTTDPCRSAAAGGGPGGAATTTANATSCDPDTGECSALGLAGAGGIANAAALGQVIPNTLKKPNGWSVTQTLTVLVVLLCLGLIIGPALVWRHHALKGRS